MQKYVAYIVNEIADKIFCKVTQALEKYKRF